MVMDFGSFRRAVNYIDGVYVDIDRDYFNDNSAAASTTRRSTSTPGYQKLMGQDALDYVRYRHGDNDFVRAARQQDFLRQAKHAVGGQASSSRASGSASICSQAFGRYFTVDKCFRSNKEILSMIRLALYLVQRRPERQRGPLPRHESRQPAPSTRDCSRPTATSRRPSASS